MLGRKFVVEPLEGRTLFTTAFSVLFNDPNNTYFAYHDEVQNTLLAAASEWAGKINGVGTIELQVSFDPNVPTAQTASKVSVPIAMTSTGIEIDEQGVTHEIRTGIDPNDAEPDALMSIGTHYLTNDLWFDPNPADRNSDSATPVPTDKVDAYSVFLHELAHAFGFNGNRDGITGVLSATSDNVESTFDQYIAADNSGNLLFTGPHAKAAYGGNVPLTFANPFHVGNRAPRPGTSIADDLMNGVGFLRGHRYNISPLDLAILTDSGVPIIGTEPTISISNITQAEGDAGLTNFVFSLSLSTFSTTAISVDYTTLNGSAFANSDFSAVQGRVTIPPGQTSATITVPVTANTVVGPDKTFSVALSDPNGATLAASTATATIINDDLPVTRTLTFNSTTAATYTDAAGRPVTVSLKGKGTGTITFTANSANADTITLASTTAKSGLVISSRATSIRKIIDPAAIGTIDAASATLTSTLSAPVSGRLLLGNISNAALTLSSSAGLTFTAKSITGSSITAGNLKFFSAGAIAHTTIGVTSGIGTFAATSLDSSTIFVGTNIPPVTLPALGTSFSKHTAAIQSLTVKGLFSATIITAPKIGTVKLGQVNVSNNLHAFGIAAHSITALTASTPANRHLKLTKLAKPAQNYTESDFGVTVI